MMIRGGTHRQANDLHIADTRLQPCTTFHQPATPHTPLQNRGFVYSLVGLTWPLGSALATAACLLLPDAKNTVAVAARGWSAWQAVMGLASVLPLVTAAALLLFPESPRWLLTRGRYEEATAIVAKIYRWNGTTNDHPVCARESCGCGTLGAAGYTFDPKTGRMIQGPPPSAPLVKQVRQGEGGDEEACVLSLSISYSRSLFYHAHSHASRTNPHTNTHPLPHSARRAPAFRSSLGENS